MLVIVIVHKQYRWVGLVIVFFSLAACIAPGFERPLSEGQ